MASDGFEAEQRKKGTAINEMVELKIAGKSISIQIDAETRFAVVEGLFNPSMWGMDGIGGLHQLVNEAIQRCPIDSRRPLYRLIRGMQILIY